MKKLFLFLGLFIVTFGISGCGGAKEEMKATSFINLSEAEAKNFTYFADDEGNKGYIAPDNSVVAYFNDQGELVKAYITTGSTVQLINIDGEMYLTDGSSEETKYIVNGKNCVIDGQTYKLDSEECKNANAPTLDYKKIIDENYKQLLK